VDPGQVALSTVLTYVPLQGMYGAFPRKSNSPTVE
jgi:hypothetical protein